MRTVILKIDNSRVMDSIESASICVTSPTGHMLTLKKKTLSKMTDGQRDVFWKVCGDPMVRLIGDVEVTIDEMKILLELSRM